MVGPWIHALFGRKKRLSDIEYLAIKEFDGKLVKNEGTLSATGTLATLTASSGKDMYIARAKVTFYVNALGTPESVADTVELQLDGTPIETAIFSFDASSEGGVLTFSYSFENIGHKVAATKAIRLECTVLDADTDIEGFVECFEETTGESPAV